VDIASQLKTVCHLDLWKAVEQVDAPDETKASQNDISQPTAKPIGLKMLPLQMPSSKRDVLMLLQSTCPVHYLRQHHLNVPIDVALRKANKSKLQTAWDGYKTYCYENSSKSNSKRKQWDENWNIIERTFRSILSGACTNAESSAGPELKINNCHTNIMAAYLHEACDAELPCWGWDNLPRDAVEKAQHVFLFLGAVRDMTTSENDALSVACSNLNIPLVPCRLGPTPEFTSKIVSVAAFHHSRGVLGPGLVHLWKRGAQKEKSLELPSKRRKVGVESSGIKVSRTTHHNNVIVPIISTALSCDPDKRDRVHWCLVRMCVCSLWRSKLAAASDDGHVLYNMLTFIFLDGICITLDQKDFTTSMAKNHKAAPSELQILEELCRRRDMVTSSKSFTLEPQHKSEIKKIIRNLVSTHLSSSHEEKRFVLNILSRNRPETTTNNLYDKAYSDDLRMNDTDRYTLFTIQEVRVASVDKSCAKKVLKIRKQLLRAFGTAGVSKTDSTLMRNGSREIQEEESCTVVLLQHLEYQSRLLPLLEMAQNQKRTD
jgi:hypothetical protein